jgi:hypothetical protein
MTSQINPNNIDGSYPVAGQDNNSQGFRDNFTNIKQNLQYAKNEISDLQTNALLKAALPGEVLDNNMNGNVIRAARIQDFSATRVAIVPGGSPLTAAVNYALSHYQTFSTTAPTTLSFSNFPVTGNYGYLKVQINITNIAHTITVPATVSVGIENIQGVSPGISGSVNIITFAETGYYELAFGTYDSGATITIFDLSRPATDFQGSSLAVTSVTATGSVSGYLRPTAGGTAANTAPVIFAAGSTVTGNVTAGSMEYDGTVVYLSPTTAQRGVSLTEHFILTPGAGRVLAQNTSAQAVFSSPTNGTITLPAAMTYDMEAVYYITNTAAPSAAHSISVLFAITGSLTSINYMADVSASSGTPTAGATAVYRNMGTAATAVQITPTGTTVGNEVTVIHIRGVVRTGTAGDFVPQIQYNTNAPGGTSTVLVNSFFRLIPLGSSTVESVGRWS